MKRLGRFSIRFLGIAACALLGFLVMGYHPGAEDDELYLTAVKSNLHPTLYSHDATFFKLQLQTTVFDTWMAGFVHMTGIPVSCAELLWQFLSIFALLWSCWLVASQLFKEASARWSSIALLATLLTLPVSGTALYIVDQYLHPRCMATALILWAVSRILAGRAWQAVPMACVAFLLHPLMGALGISYCAFLAAYCIPSAHSWVIDWGRRLVARPSMPLLFVLPASWMFSAPTPLWMQAVGSRHWYRLYDWEWYEWLGAIAPLIIFGVVHYFARQRCRSKLSRLSIALVCYGSFQLAVAMFLLWPGRQNMLGALEPMRFLHLIYIFLVLTAGGYLGKYVLRTHVWRWAAVLLVFSGGMLYAQRQLFASSSHIELPGAQPSSTWLEAFNWIRNNTPADAYFVLNPHYMEADGEDYHGFRALAERSHLADDVKDTSMITKTPSLGPLWNSQVEAQQGWQKFMLTDFERLKRDFGVDWALIDFPAPAGLDCRWHKQQLTVCRIP